MNNEQEIDPKVLVEQEGPYTGAITEPELAQVGAESEENGRNDSRWNPSAEQLKELKDDVNDESSLLYGKNLDKVKNGDQLHEAIADAKGEDAMKSEVGRRAEAMVADASEDLRKQVREAAEAKFKAEIEAKSSEKQTAADDRARELLAKINGSASISEVIPESDETTEPESEAAQAFNVS